MRTLVIKTDENEKQTAVRFLPYNTTEDKVKCFAYINEMQNRDFNDGKLFTYGRTDIGFDVHYSPDNSAFLNANPEYEKYAKLCFKAGDVTGTAFFKKWDCVEKAKELGAIKDDVYNAICESDRANISFKIEDLGCLHNDNLLRRISLNIAEEIKRDDDILDCLRLGDNRKKDNVISYKNWITDESIGDAPKEYNSVTYRNGGEAFSLLFDMDMNLLTIKYCDHVFQDGRNWIPFEDATVKDCLMMIYDKLPDMEFNLWLADMGDNERYEQIKAEFNEFLPEAEVSSYFPLKDLGSGYFIVTDSSDKNLQMAVNIKEGEISGFRFKTHGSTWQAGCPDPESVLAMTMTALLYTGHISKDIADPREARINLLYELTERIRVAAEKSAEGNLFSLDMLLAQMHKAYEEFYTDSDKELLDKQNEEEHSL